jgi:signal peptidase I
MTALRHLGRGAATLITGVAVLAAVAAGILVWAGYRPQPVLSGSMEPTLPVGSLAVAKAVPADSVREGDVITFGRPSGQPGTITHRITDITISKGRRAFTTKGDANPSADPWQLRLPDQVGKQVATVPYAGYVALYAARPQVRASAIALLTLVLIFGALRAIWRPSRPTATA